MGALDDDTWANLAAQARKQLNARTDGAHCFEVLPASPGRGFHLLPAPIAGDLFFDMQGDPLHDEGLEYLFGLVGPSEGAGSDAARRYRAHKHAAEKTSVETSIR